MYVLRGSMHKFFPSHQQALLAARNGVLATTSAKSSLHSCMACGFSTAGTKRVGTHNGNFHCNEALACFEAFACFMIRLTNKFYGAQIVRTRDPLVLEALDTVVDVGFVYDPSRDLYNHHQKEFEEIFGHGFTTKLSSAGLVYKHYGAEIIAKEL
ncbi:hypothetical protein SLE2022_374500 [Rubroshorea leprosula]